MVGGRCIVKHALVVKAREEVLPRLLPVFACVLRGLLARVDRNRRVPHPDRQGVIVEGHHGDSRWHRPPETLGQPALSKQLLLISALAATLCAADPIGSRAPIVNL